MSVARAPRPRPPRRCVDALNSGVLSLVALLRASSHDCCPVSALLPSRTAVRGEFALRRAAQCVVPSRLQRGRCLVRRQAPAWRRGKHASWLRALVEQAAASLPWLQHRRSLRQCWTPRARSLLAVVPCGRPAALRAVLHPVCSQVCRLPGACVWRRGDACAAIITVVRACHAVQQLGLRACSRDRHLQHVRGCAPGPAAHALHPRTRRGCSAPLRM